MEADVQLMEEMINTKEVLENKNSGPDLLDGSSFRKAVLGGAANLRHHAGEVNDLNVFPVPDGDTGDNMRMTIEGGLDSIISTEAELSLGEAASNVAHGMLIGARGNSGVILSQLFDGIAAGLKNCDKADVITVGAALALGVKQAYRAVLTPTEGTILTVARESVEYAVSRIDENSTLASLFGDLLSEMGESLKRTPEMLDVLKQAGVVDSGGAGLYYITEGMVMSFGGDLSTVIPDYSAENKVKSITSGGSIVADYSAFNEDSEMVYGYCTELLLQLQKKKVDIASFDIGVIQDFLNDVGDSVVAVLNGSIVKIHVHTMAPEKVLEFCRRYGEFLNVKIENMTLQHSEIADYGENQAAVSAGTDSDKNEAALGGRKRYGVAAVVSGEGLEQLFSELGTDVIIHGGQTNNPSTAEFLEAFAKINAEHIFVFPNNKNIILTANQAAANYSGAEVHVIRSRDIGMGYAGLSCADFTLESAEEVLAGIESPMGNVVTGFVSTATRDVVMDGVEVKKDDCICFIDKRLVGAEKDAISAAALLCGSLLDEGDRFMLTIFTGKDADESKNSVLEEMIRERHPDTEIYFTSGGQGVYEYIVMAE